MLDPSIVCAIISAISAIVVAVISARASKKAQAERAELKKNEDRNTRERLLTMKLLSASCKLSTVTAKAVFNHKTNGDVQDAFDSAQEAQQEYFDFINEVAVNSLSKKS